MQPRWLTFYPPLECLFEKTKLFTEKKEVKVRSPSSKANQRRNKIIEEILFDLSECMEEAGYVFVLAYVFQ